MEYGLKQEMHEYLSQIWKEVYRVLRGERIWLNFP